MVEEARSLSPIRTNAISLMTLGRSLFVLEFVRVFTLESSGICAEGR